MYQYFSIDGTQVERVANSLSACWLVMHSKCHGAQNSKCYSIIGLIVAGPYACRLQQAVSQTGCPTPIRRFSGTKTRGHVYKAYSKPDLDYCLPVWGNYGTAQATAVNKLLTRAKRIIRRNNSTELSNSDYNLFYISDFNNIVFLAVVCQFHRCMYGDLQYSDFNKLSQVQATRAFISMKFVTDRNRKCCDNNFTFAAPKLWNRLPNSITCISNFNVFYVSAVKHTFK